ncbi:hypothetical protein G4H71_15665 [Rhodococcus triatomae]|nr:hypothetical protein G4H72_14705 [Rhodococcus triatomae]QNG25803.1 hypothetical protein G4H71_15665 [Rhodococcus triatomae]
MQWQPPRTPPRPAPVDVHTARHLWWAVAGLGLLQGLMAVAVVAGDRDAFVDQLLREPTVQSGEVTLDQGAVETLFAVGIGVTALIVVVVTALFLLIVRTMTRGRAWARTVLTVVGVLLTVMTVPLLFGAGDDFAPAGATGTMLLGAAQILQAVTAVGAIVLMYRKESNAFFLPGPPPENQGRW